MSGSSWQVSTAADDAGAAGALNGDGCAGPVATGGLELFYKVAEVPLGGRPALTIDPSTLSTPATVSGDGSIYLRVRRSGDATGAITVQYTTVDGTAIAGTDYVAASGTISWADKDTSAATIGVAVLPRTTLMPALVFSVTLRGATAGVFLDGDRAKSVVSIAADAGFSIGPLTLVETGGVMDAALNVALLGTAFSTQAICCSYGSAQCDCYPYHRTNLINDAKYGNFASFIPEASMPSASGRYFVGIRFAKAQRIVGVAWGRDNTPAACGDRWAGFYTVQVTSVLAPSEQTPDSAWTTVDRVAGVSPSRHRYSFNGAAVTTGVRLVLEPADLSRSASICIDEFEIYGASVTTALDDALVAGLEFSSVRVTVTSGLVTAVADSGPRGFGAIGVGGVAIVNGAVFSSLSFSRPGYLKVDSFRNYAWGRSFAISVLLARAEGASGNAVVAANGVGATSSWEIRMAAQAGGTRIGAGIVTATKSSSWDFDTVAQPGGRWHHVVLTYDGTVGTLYVDGVGQSKTISGGACVTRSAPLCVGSHGDSSLGEDFVGQIADFRVWNRSLTNTDVASLWNGYSATIAKDGVRLWWRLIDKSLGVRDFGRFGLAGSIGGGAAWLHGALWFNGATAYALSTSNIGIVGDVPFSMAAWIYWDGTALPATDVTIMGIDAAGPANQALSLGVAGGGYVSLDFWSHRILAVVALTATQQWFFVGATKNPGAKLANTMLYIDSVSVATRLDGLDMAPSIQDGPLALGRTAGSRWWKGGIDDVRVYDVVLSAAAVRALYGGGVTVDWALREGSGPTVADASGMGKRSGAIAYAPWIRSRLYFSAVGESVQSNLDSGLQGAAAITLAAFVYCNGSTWRAATEIAGLRGAAGGAKASSAFILTVRSGVPSVDFSGTRIAAATGLRTFVWYHLAAVLLGGASSKLAGTAIYVNGRPFPTTLVDAGAGAAENNLAASISDGPLVVGAVSGGTSAASVHVGYIDDVKLYRRALSASEVAVLAADPMGRHSTDIALKLSGNGDFATLPPLVFGGDFTIEMWLRARAPENWPQYLFEACSGDANLVVALRASQVCCVAAGFVAPLTCPPPPPPVLCRAMARWNL